MTPVGSSLEQDPEPCQEQAVGWVTLCVLKREASCTQRHAHTNTRVCTHAQSRQARMKQTGTLRLCWKPPCWLQKVHCHWTQRSPWSYCLPVKSKFTCTFHPCAAAKRFPQCTCSWRRNGLWGPLPPQQVQRCLLLWGEAFSSWHWQAPATSPGQLQALLKCAAEPTPHEQPGLPTPVRFYREDLMAPCHGGAGFDFFFRYTLMKSPCLPLSLPPLFCRAEVVLGNIIKKKGWR